MSEHSNVKNLFNYVDDNQTITIGGIPIEEVDNPDYDLVSKIAATSIDLYMKSPKMFIAEFNKLSRQLKLNIKIKETYKTKEERKRVYAAISFYDKMIKKQSYNEAYEIASKYYNIPEKFLRSIVGTRNNLRRSGLKMSESSMNINF